MLSRIGNNLFWLGRYIERAEHIARYTKVQYASSVGAPMSKSRELVLESVLELSGSKSSYFNTKQQLDEEEVISFIAISEANPFSILGYIGMIRENARGVRDSISIELWEAINSFYHKINGYASTDLPSEEIEFFSKKIEENSYVIKGYIENTLLRNEVWKLISLGIYIERAIQVCLILQTKMQDIEKLNSPKLPGALENHQWTTILQSTESFDMYMRCQKTNPNRRNVLNFLLFDTDFPKSVAFSLASVEKCIQGITFREENKDESPAFMAGKLACHLQFSSINEIEDTAAEFLETTLDRIYELAYLIDNKYLKFN